MPLALIAVGVPWGTWCFYVLLGDGSQSVVFVATAGWFVILALGYLGLHGLGDMAWTSAPVLLTLEALAGFVFIPFGLFASGDAVIDAGYAHAMFLVLIGFAAFWVGSSLFRHERGFRFVPAKRDTRDRVATVSAAMLVVGVGGNLLLWKAGLYVYAADELSRAANLGILPWLNFLTSLLSAALVVSSIEVLGKRSKRPLINIVFGLALPFSLGFGVISGMKSGPLIPLINITLIFGITNKRIPRTALLLPILLVVVIYPFVTAYRNNLNSGYRAQVNTLEGQEDLLEKSIQDAFLSYGSTSGDTRRNDTREAEIRLSYLTYVRDVSELPFPSLLNGDEKVWMAPFYPLVPRLIWKEKPVLDKGHRLSIALGRPGITSSAPTPIGDLYAMYGPYGVAVGMFVWGICLQLFMNWFGRGNDSERSLFIYMLMLPILLNLEGDVVSIVAGTVQQAFIVFLMSTLIYGRTASRPRVARIRSSSGA